MNKYKRLLETTENMTRRELKTRYAGSFLGPLWSVVYPSIFTVITMTIFSFFFHGSIDGIPYFLFILIGFDCWFWFNLTVTNATRSLINNRDLIINNKFPTESIIFGIANVRLIDHIINVIMFYILLAILHRGISINNVILVLFISSCQFIFQIGISLITSSINIYIRDIQNIIDIILQLVFYGSPIIYSINILSPQLQKLILINPLTQIVTAYRDALFNRYISVNRLALILLLSLTTFMLGYLIYKKLESKFAELI